MSPNDRIVLKTNFDKWRNEAGDLEGIDSWLYYCLEQFLKQWAPEEEELRDGLTDGGNDGGADGIYFLVNQRQFVNEDTELDPKAVTKIRLMFFQVKNSGGFKPTEIEKWIQLADDFFDLSKDPETFGTRYNKKIKTIMRVWREQFLRVSGEFAELQVDFYYITPDDVISDDYANDAGERVKVKVKHHVNGNCDVHLIGAHELWGQVQKRPPKSKVLVWAEAPMSTAEGFVGLVKLKDFNAFLQDEPGVLAERIFESNVRGYQPDSTINTRIYQSLIDPQSANFWLLNNGVTIIAPRTQQAGHLRLSIDDPQIVNGLQTSRVIFGYFGEEDRPDENRTVLVRVIETTDLALQDRIIRATNSQNKMASASLRMTDQIHRDIEEFFKKVDLFYDRRKGHHRDQGRPVRKIVSVNFVAQAVISILLQRPDDARARPGDYFKEDDKYESIFANDKTNVGTYLSCVQIVHRIEQFLIVKGIEKSDGKNLKFYVAAFLVRELTGLEMPVSAKLPTAAKVDDQTIGQSYERIRKVYETLSKTVDKDAVARGPLLLKRLSAQWKRRQTKAGAKKNVT